MDARDAKAGSPSVPGSVDPRVAKIVAEAWRHAKAIGAVGDGAAVLDEVGIPIGSPGVSVGEPGEVVADLIAALASHRAWERFAAPA
jgi:catalase